MKLTYAVIYERTPNNYSAYLPDLPGCVAVGATRDEVEENIRAAAAFHIEGIQQDGDPIPKPRMSARQAKVRHAVLLLTEKGRRLLNWRRASRSRRWGFVRRIRRASRMRGVVPRSAMLQLEASAALVEVEIHPQGSARVPSGRGALR